jgi:E3 ubiquitin-protein ligase HUWE1
MTSAIRQQIDAFLSGFYDIVPPQIVAVFSPAELELLICGLPDVRVEDFCAVNH